MTKPGEWVEAIEDNLIEAWEFLAGLPDVEYYKSAHFIRYIGGIPFPLCNSIMRANFSAEGLDRQIDEALAPILLRRLPLFWWIGPATRPAGLGERLAERGLRLAEEIPGMAADLHAAGGDDRGLPGLTIREVMDGDTLDTWMEVFGTAFEIPDVAVDFFRNAIGAGRFRPGVPYRHYLGLWKDEPVACSSVYFGRAAAGIYNVATLASFRGRGIGAQMTRRLVRIARERGMGTAVLHSSPLGRPVYEKLGFRERCRLSVYLHQPVIEVLHR